MYLILYTCRKDELLVDAVKWCKLHGLVFDRINDNHPENIKKYGYSRKVFADFYLDDRNILAEDLEKIIKD